MVPNRRLREELARADRLAKQRRANQFDDQATVVPIEDRVPEETRPGNIRDYAADILEVDEDIELHTGDMEKVDPSAIMALGTSDIDISDLTDETPNPDHLRTRVRPHGAVVPKTEKSPPRGAPKLQ